MIGSAPDFWWAEPDWRARALTPLSLIYGAVARSRLLNAARERMELPILCVGNLTVGGSGKTPVAIALAKSATAAGLRPGFLTRGHGGRIRGPHLVDPGRDDAAAVGDEPLLLAAHSPVALTPKRADGARLLASEGCDFIIMDDGFQSARIHMDYALIVLDGKHGVGNGRVLPAGPLRAPLDDQFRYADGFVRVGAGTGEAGLLQRVRDAGKPFFEASLRVRDRERFAGRRFLAFAGIGHPTKFFDTVRLAGGLVEMEKSFPDHHPYSQVDIDRLGAMARSKGLSIVTTAKDAVRIHRSAIASASIETLEIEIIFDQAAAPDMIIEQTMRAWRNRTSLVDSENTLA